MARFPFDCRLPILSATCCWLLAGLLPHVAGAAEKQPARDKVAPADPAGVEFFEKKIRPLLAFHCQKCHGPDKQESNLRLDSRAALLTGGDRGPAVEPGQPNKSLLIDAVNHGETVQMPPKAKLSPVEIADLTTWVKLGAPWPDDSADSHADAAAGGTPFTDEQRQFWSFVPPRDPPIPKVKRKTWPTSTLDYFILAALEAKGLEPAPPAEKRQLIRRATFDLIGLPPTPAEVRAFERDESPNAFAKVVDRLLASPQYGERWARHWLDVARYADSNGMDENLCFGNAFRYRDYVVAAFNRDKPYDQFVREQIAGDLLADGGNEIVRLNQVLGTGFLAIGPKLLAEPDAAKMEMDIVDEQIDTVGRAFMGLTLGCARCHDHKFDPLPTADYYSLAGVFQSTRVMESYTRIARWYERPWATKRQVAEREAHERLIQLKQEQLTSLVAAADEQLLDGFRADVGKYLLAATEALDDRPVVGGRYPIGGTAWSQELGDKGVLLEAESFPRGNVGLDKTVFGVGIGVLRDFGPRPNYVEFDIDLAQAGDYQVELRYASAESRPLTLSVNGVEVSRDAAGEITGGFYPQQQRWVIAGVFPFKKGMNLLRLERATAFPHIDKLLVVAATRSAGAKRPGGKTVDKITVEQVASRDKLNAAVIYRWKDYLARTDAERDPIFAPWHALRRVKPAQFAAEAARLAKRIATSEADDSVSPPVRALFAKDAPRSLAELAERYGELFATIDASWRQLQRVPELEGQDKLLDPAEEAVRQVLHDELAGPFIVPPHPDTLYAAEAKQQITQLQAAIEGLEKSRPPLPEAMGAADADAIQNARIHLRGNHLTLGAEVPRRFPRILAGDDQQPIDSARSGRLELAQWLTQPDHPLTARVMVNRIWRWHFGEGIVRTPDNFGQLGERPTHPELLDWLARRFVEKKWSIKELHRLVMLSATYQMGGADNPLAAQIDPDNRLLWHRPRQRLEAEALRDSLLCLGGQLDPTLGGSLLSTNDRDYVTNDQSKIASTRDNNRRSLYQPVMRNALDDMFLVFDFPDPATIAGSRATTTVAPQALFMLNGKLVLSQSRRLAESLLGRTDLDDSQRVGEAYLRALSRVPSDKETAAALAFVRRYDEALAGRKKAPDEAERRVLAWQSLCQAILASNEFIYID